MTNSNSAAQAANDNPLSDEYVNAIIQRHGYDSPETVIARLAQWIGLHGGENGVTLLMYEAHKALSKLRAPVADEPPGGTRWPVLRAMARNYTAGKHTWDALDAEACEQAAEEIRHLRAALASAPVAGQAVALELRGVPETIKEGGGFWRSCTGCHELNEGRDTGPYSAVLGCHLGQGCGECGGIGAIWDSTDYQTMADDMARDMGQSVSVAPLASAPEAAEAQPVAYLTRDEEGSPCMLFFDVVEARGYCAPGEEPEPLFRHAGPQPDSEPVGWFDTCMSSGTVRWRPGLTSTGFPEGHPFYAAPQASALNAEYTRGRADGFDAGHSAALEKVAAALEDHRNAGREWVPGSLWDTLSREAAARIRALKQPQASNACGGALTDDVALPPLPAELRDTETHSREYAHAAVLFDRLKQARGGENHV